MIKHFTFISLILLAFFGASFLLLGQGGQNPGDYPDAREYAPNFWFDSEERYYPADPLDFYYDENGNELPGAAAVANYDKLTLEQKLDRAKVFYKVDDSGSEYVYQYWIFYVMNNYENGHYGDWESIFVFVDKETGNINKAVGSAHGSGHKLEIKSEDTQNIWAYVGLGSHASCPDEIADGSCDFLLWSLEGQGFDWTQEDVANGKKLSYDSYALYKLSSSYLDNFQSQNSFNKQKSPTLGVNPYKLVNRFIKTDIPFVTIVDTTQEKYYNLPLIGEFVGKTPTFAWTKPEYERPYEILTPTHTKLARNISGFFNNAGSFLAAVGNTITAPFAGLVGGDSNMSGSDPDILAQDDSESNLRGQTPIGATPTTPSDAPTVAPESPVATPTATPNQSGQGPSGTGQDPTPIPEPTSPEPELELALATRIIDGDTVELASGQKLRYIGINAPETPNGCYSSEATAKNSDLVLGKQILLLGFGRGQTPSGGQTPISNDTDQYGRLLRFAWQDVNRSGTIDSPDIFVNRELVAGGYAYSFNFGEKHKYDQVFEASEAKAKRERQGLWGRACRPTVEELENPKPIIRKYEPPNSVVSADSDTTPPDAPVSSIADNTFFNSYSDANSQEDGYQAVLAGTAEASSRVTITQNPTYTATTTEEGAWSAEVTFLNEGANNFSITATDAAGNTSTSTIVTLNLDSIAPTSTIAITNYSADSDQFKVNWDADAADLDYYEVEYRVGSIGTWQDWENATTTDVNKNYQNAANGTYYFRVRGVDTHQNIGPWQESAGVVIDLYAIVINEIQVNDAEFVELYNPTANQISLKDYYFAYYPSTRVTWSGTSTPYGPQLSKKFENNAKIPATGHFLIGLDGYPETGGNPNADWQVYTSKQLSNSQGTVAIFPFDPKSYATTSSQFVYDNRVDAVGWGSGISLREQSSATSTPAAAESLTRDNSHTDTDNNSADFTVATSTTPTNSAGETYIPPASTNPIWAMYQKDSRHSGLATFSGPTWASSASTSVAWTFEMKKGQGFEGARSQPVIGSDGTVYVTSALGNVYAINPDGSQKWKFEPAKNSEGGDGDGQADTSPALSADSSVVYSVYKDTDNGKLILYAINTSDKSLLWKYSVAASSAGFTSPVLDSAGNIYVASEYKLHSIPKNYQTGNPPNWEFAPYSGYSNFALWTKMPAISQEGGVEYIYIAANMSNNIGDKYIFKLDTNGNEVTKGQLTDAKSLSNGTSVSSAGALYTGGYVSYGTSALYALNPDLSEIWFAPLGANVSGPAPNFDAEGNIYIGTSGAINSGAFHKLSATGTILWSFTDANPGANQHPAVVDSQGRVYTSAMDNFVYALDPNNGTVIWKYQLSSEPRGFAIGDGRVYVVGYEGKLYSFGE